MTSTSAMVSIIDCWKFSWLSLFGESRVGISWGNPGITEKFPILPLTILSQPSALIGMILSSGGGTLAPWTQVLVWQFKFLLLFMWPELWPGLFKVQSHWQTISLKIILLPLCGMFSWLAIPTPPPPLCCSNQSSWV